MGETVDRSSYSTTSPPHHRLIIALPALVPVPGSRYRLRLDQGEDGRSQDEGGEQMRARMSRSRLLLGVGFLGLVALMISWGRHGSLSTAIANPPVPAPAGAQPDSSPPAAGQSSDY